MQIKTIISYDRLGMGLILFPMNIAALGNTAGLTGSYFPIVLISVLTVHLLTAHSYRALFAAGPGEGREASPDAPRTDPFRTLLMGSRLSLAISAVPLILVSAGFIFNELFLYGKRLFPGFCPQKGLEGMVPFKIPGGKQIIPRPAGSPSRPAASFTPRFNSQRNSKRFFGSFGFWTFVLVSDFVLRISNLQVL